MEWSGVIDGLGAALSVSSGGLFGLIGSAVGVVAKYFQERQRQKWEKEKWAHEKDLLKLQMERGDRETENELAIVEANGSWGGLRDSIQAAGKITDVHRWVNDIRALFRLILTLVLWGIATWMFCQVVDGKLQVWFSEMEIKDIVRYMVYSTFFMAGTAAGWWFGDRALTPPWG